MKEPHPGVLSRGRAVFLLVVLMLATGSFMRAWELDAALSGGIFRFLFFVAGACLACAVVAAYRVMTTGRFRSVPLVVALVRSSSGLR